MWNNVLEALFLVVVARHGSQLENLKKYGRNVFQEFNNVFFVKSQFECDQSSTRYPVIFVGVGTVIHTSFSVARTHKT